MLEKVLIVNDNPLLSMIAKKMIELSDFAKETITAQDGLEALNYFKSLIEQGPDQTHTAPEFMFLDLHMPYMDGWEFLEIFTDKYARHFPNLKIAILSASVEMEDMLLLVKYPIVVNFVDSVDEVVLENIKQNFFVQSFQES